MQTFIGAGSAEASGGKLPIIAFSTATPLTNGQTYDSTVLSLDGYTQVQTHILSDADGTIVINFIRDAAGTDVLRTLTIPYTGGSGYQTFSAPAFTPFVRYRFTADAAGQTDFYFDTKFLVTALSPQILGVDAFISPLMTASLNRSVLVAENPLGTYKNVPITVDSELAVDVPKTIFGETLVAELTPTVQISNPYSLDLSLRDDLQTFTGASGTAASAQNLFQCKTGASIGGYGVIRSVNTVRYRPGEGAIARITSTFTTGVANSLQFAGLFSLTETAAFGFDGADFSVIHEYDGEAEIQEIQITATAADTVTVTLDGTAASGISITNSTVQTNAREIADALAADSAVNGAWRFEQVDDTVICIAKSVGDKTGTFSISFAGSATGSITEIEAGISKSSGNVAQADWDYEPFSGFDPTQLNIYQIEYGYLGGANIIFKIYNPTTSKFQTVHSIKWANANTTPNFGNPDMKIGWTAASLGSTTDLTVTGGSAMGGVEGKQIIQENSRALFQSLGSIGTSPLNLFTIQNRIVYGERFNLGNIEPILISIDNDHNKGVIIEVVKNAQLGGVPNFQFHDEVNSILTVDTSATTVTGGTVIDAFTVGATSAKEEDLGKLDLILLPEETLTVSARTISGTGATVTGTFTWKEEK
jgi:hypothetical protein